MTLYMLRGFLCLGAILSGLTASYSSAQGQYLITALGLVATWLAAFTAGLYSSR
jgi:hypothetical protein